MMASKPLHIALYRSISGHNAIAIVQANKGSGGSTCAAYVHPMHVAAVGHAFDQADIVQRKALEKGTLTVNEARRMLGDEMAAQLREGAARFMKVLESEEAQGNTPALAMLHASDAVQAVDGDKASPASRKARGCVVAIMKRVRKNVDGAPF